MASTAGDVTYVANDVLPWAGQADNSQTQPADCAELTVKTGKSPRSCRWRLRFHSLGPAVALEGESQLPPSAR